MSGFFTSTEFYVIASLAAATIVGLCVKPPSRGMAIERLLAGKLCLTDSVTAEPEVTLACDESGDVMLTRSGLTGIRSEGAVSLAVTKIGTDLTIEERVVGSTVGEPVDTALFVLDFLSPGRYHVQYNSFSLGLFAAFSFTVRSGNVVSRSLRQ